MHLSGLCAAYLRLSSSVICCRPRFFLIDVLLGETLAFSMIPFFERMVRAYCDTFPLMSGRMTLYMTAASVVWSFIRTLQKISNRHNRYTIRVQRKQPRTFNNCTSSWVKVGALAARLFVSKAEIPPLLASADSSYTAQAYE